MEKPTFSNPYYRTAIAISLSYALFASLWVLLSDQLLLSMIDDPKLLTLIQSLKGALFVIISGIFLYGLLHKAIDKLRHSENSYLKIFDSTIEAFFIHDRHTGQIVAVNQAAINMFGYSKVEAKQLTINNLQLDVLESDIEFSPQPNNASPAPFLRQSKKKNGDTFWVEVSTQHLDIKGKHLNMTTVRDITFRKQTDDILRALAESATLVDNEIYQTIVHQIASSLDIRYVLLAVISPHDSTKLETIVAWDTDRFIEKIQYKVINTPCANVIKDGMCWYPDKLAQLFPKDQFITDLNLCSYLGVPLKNSNNDVLGVMCLIDDKPMKNNQAIDLINSLAVRASIELERQESNEKHKLSSRVFTDSHEGIVITDTQGNIIDVNPTFCSVTGYSHDEVIGKTPQLLRSGKHDQNFYNDMWTKLNKDGHWQGEISNRKKNGELYIELLKISSLKNKSGEIINYVGIFTDITQSKEQQRQLELMAHYDVLTKLPNRILFADRFKQASANSRRTDTLLAVCFLDLDNFKPVNDTYGHTTGDKLLIEVAKRIKATIREEDTVSRQGGDEFAILLVNLASPFESDQLLSRVHQSLAQPYYIDSHVISISASMGITLYPVDDKDLDILLRHADQAMYQAKLKGRNNYEYFNIEDDQKTLNNHLRLQKVAFALDNQQLCLYYQPKLNMRTGKIVGAEALIRWNHPEHGLIPPMEFLPIIEGTNLEIKVGNWVIEQAVKQIGQWQDQGINLEISVNISSQHLLNINFHDELDSIFNKHPNVDQKLLQLEILETSVLSDLELINQTLQDCQNRFNISFALDDFGTGYSSLTHLRNLPVNTLKIDQSFVRDMLIDPNDYAIIDGVIGLTQSFDLELIAEGVETTEHGLILLMMGCDLAQGYGIAKPMPTSKFDEWLNNYTPNPIWQNHANEALDIKQKHLKLLKMTLTKWLEKFNDNILSTTSAQDWPILDPTKCHCNSWIKKEKQGQIFNLAWLSELEGLHEKLHNTANEIYHTYQQGNQKQAKLELTRLDDIVVQINDVLLLS